MVGIFRTTIVIIMVMAIFTAVATTATAAAGARTLVRAGVSISRPAPCGCVGRQVGAPLLFPILVSAGHALQLLDFGLYLSRAPHVSGVDVLPCAAFTAQSELSHPLAGTSASDTSLTGPSRLATS